MIKLALALLCCTLATPCLHAQANATATQRAGLQVGVEASAFNLDNSTGREEGFGVYADFDVSKHLGVEALYRDASIVTPQDIGENHLLAGPRFHLTRGRFSPFAKVLVGEGTINYQQGFNASTYSEHYFAYVLGAGLDVRVSRRISVRLLDLEYQSWPGFAPHGLNPYGDSLGVAYHF